ncbi:MAG TPA: CHAD domain-containing protein [Candidatus Binatia bacterium]|nr:CHAD domain-containing protein [Candidatus Binatia bacterium]
MSFYLLEKESVEEGIKRIADEQIAQAIEEIDNPKLKRPEAIHQVRKRCKKVRAVLRIVRPQFEETYQFENAWFRDTAKNLADLRDAQAIIETYDSLLEKFSDQIDRRTFAPVRRALTLRQKKILKETGDLDQQLEEIRNRMRKAGDRVPDWKLKVDGFDAIGGGLLATYRRAQKAMTAAYENSTAENFHEWRKRAKYHGYHMRLLRELWKPVMRSLRSETDELSDLLGDDHNLAVFHKTLLESPNKYGNKRDIQALLGLIDRRSAELRMEAKTIGAKIFAEKPKALGRRFRTCWLAWRSEVERPPEKLSEEPAVVTAAG